MDEGRTGESTFRGTKLSKPSSGVVTGAISSFPRRHQVHKFRPPKHF